MGFLVTGAAQAHQVAVGIGKLRILIRMFDVMDSHGLGLLAIPFAQLAEVAVPSEYFLALLFPAPGIVIKLHFLSPPKPVR